MSERPTPETEESIERWRQGKINIFNEMSRIERERDEARELARSLYSVGYELRRFTAAYAHDYDEVDGKPGAIEAISDFYDASKDIAKILGEEGAK